MADPTGANITADDAILINQAAPALFTNRVGERLRNIREDLPVFQQVLTSEAKTGTATAVDYTATFTGFKGAKVGDVFEIIAVLKTTAVHSSPATDVIQLKVGSTAISVLSRTAAENDVICLRSKVIVLTTGATGTTAGFSAADELAGGSTLSATASGGGNATVNMLTGEAVTVNINPGHANNSTTLLALSMVKQGA